MLFIGAIPRPVVEQALRVVDLDGATDVFVCCSGSFRMEQALAAKHPELRVHSNDVSLLSSALGYAAVGHSLEFKFTGKLAFLEELLTGMDPRYRLGALMVAVQMGHFNGKHEFGRKHLEHYEANAPDYVARATEKLPAYLERLKIASFTSCDFTDHAQRAVEQDAVIIGWPPTRAGGYEHLYRLVNQNTEWEEPAYNVWKPAKLGPWLDDLDAADARYCVCADHELEGRKAAALYSPGRGRSVYLYTSRPRAASLRRVTPPARAFRYEPVVTSALTKRTRVEVVQIGHREMNFLKDKYLASGLVHSDGMMWSIVLLDGKLAGGFIYSMSQMGEVDVIYLLCDFAVARDARLSKLIAMLATGQDAVSKWERARVTRISRIFTTAFTDKPVSMKYRGIYDLVGRKPGFLNYASPVRRVANRAIYADWWRRYAASPNRPTQAS